LLSKKEVITAIVIGSLATIVSNLGFFYLPPTEIFGWIVLWITLIIGPLLLVLGIIFLVILLRRERGSGAKLLQKRVKKQIEALQKKVEVKEKKIHQFNEEIRDCSGIIEALKKYYDNLDGIDV
jgi:hypothetical protein